MFPTFDIYSSRYILYFHILITHNGVPRPMLNNSPSLVLNQLPLSPLIWKSTEQICWNEAAASVCAWWLLVSCLRLERDAQVHRILSGWEDCNVTSTSNVLCLLVLNATIKGADVLAEAFDMGTNWFYTLFRPLLLISISALDVCVPLLSSSAVSDYQEHSFHPLMKKRNCGWLLLHVPENSQ